MMEEMCKVSKKVIKVILLGSGSPMELLYLGLDQPRATLRYRDRGDLPYTQQQYMYSYLLPFASLSLSLHPVVQYYPWSSIAKVVRPDEQRRLDFLKMRLS